MDETRRNFLKLAGFSALGTAWSVPVVKAIAEAIKTEPAPGAISAKQWAMVVDLEKCAQASVRQAAIEACHLLHNVPNFDDPKEEIKWIWTESFEHAFPGEVHKYTAKETAEKPVLVLCNHCEKPACVRVCPTKATWRREDGIVMMDMHRCIGCRYCMTACPYGSRSFNFKEPYTLEERKTLVSNYPTRCKGVVEKCNFCADRLALGQVPACVEAVNQVAGGEGALFFGDIADQNSEVARVLAEKHTIRRKPNLGTGPQVYYLV